MSEVLATAAPQGTQLMAIEVRELTKRYGDLTAVEGVSLDVPAGQVLGLLGPNGAGKTTTIKMMTGLVTPTSGTVSLGGYDVSRRRSQAVQQVGAVLEGSRNVYWSLSAWQNLLYFGRLKGLRKSEIRPRAERLLRELGLWERRDHQVGGFSRGMAQKVAVAAALITDPPIVLLDEPTIGLDVEAARTVRDWVLRLAHQEGKTVVLTTHQLAMAEELADRVAVIREGRIITDLPTRELLDRYVEDRYDITIDSTRGVDGLRVAGVPELTASSADGQAAVHLPTADQDVLYTVLAALHADSVPVLDVSRVRPSLEDVFLKLLRSA
ncbi:ABC-2 type transport system ATP-binding protein [Kribbella aluminosa]|uniref:ABC-2 type transport system ATP-binding protein n=1 Tax=Kribbella aluminosa TaxID=416017 RepID=A0ABS4UWI0_9ACTN|nr:ABC transporter ATP-binding protein [Kribbella aluminosa]MBP2356009.1 ABC-2 type transport system ATP-binding protein [Kribbella aluminosa]